MLLLGFFSFHFYITHNITIASNTIIMKTDDFCKDEKRTSIITLTEPSCWQVASSFQEKALWEQSDRSFQHKKEFDGTQRRNLYSSNNHLEKEFSDIFTRNAEITEMPSFKIGWTVNLPQMMKYQNTFYYSIDCLCVCLCARACVCQFVRDMFKKSYITYNGEVC